MDVLLLAAFEALSSTTVLAVAGAPSLGLVVAWLVQLVD